MNFRIFHIIWFDLLSFTFYASDLKWVITSFPFFCFFIFIWLKISTKWISQYPYSASLLSATEIKPEAEWHPIITLYFIFIWIKVSYSKSHQSDWLNLANLLLNLISEAYISFTFYFDRLTISELKSVERQNKRSKMDAVFICFWY